MAPGITVEPGFESSNPRLWEGKNRFCTDREREGGLNRTGVLGRGGIISSPRGRSGASYIAPPGIFPLPQIFSPHLLGDNFNKG